MTRNLGPAEPPAPVGYIRSVVETHDGLVATGGLCAPMSPFYDWSRPRFAPVPFWRNWRRRWTAGGPLLGHVTPPPTPPFRGFLPTFTAPRGGIRYIAP